MAPSLFLRYLNNFKIFYGYASSIPGITLALFAGALSDREYYAFLMDL